MHTKELEVGWSGGLDSATALRMMLPFRPLPPLFIQYIGVGRLIDVDLPIWLRGRWGVPIGLGRLVSWLVLGG